MATTTKTDKKYFVKFENHTHYYKDMEFVSIECATDDQGRDWYDVRATLHEDTLKVYVYPENMSVFSLTRDTSPAIPYREHNFYEVYDNGEYMSAETPLMLDMETMTLKVDTKAIKMREFYNNFYEARTKANRIIDELKIKIEDVEYGGEDDEGVDWRNEIKEWVRYRRFIMNAISANDYDAVLPKEPAQHLEDL